MDADALDLPDRPGGISPHVFVESVVTPQLNDEDLHHLMKVRRCRDGDLVSASDGAGSWRWCILAGTSLTVVGEVLTAERCAPSLTVAFALMKGSKPELVVQKLTEIGIDTIIPFTADRSVVRWDDAKTERQTDRLAKVALDAAAQSRRVWLPTIAPVAQYADLVQNGSVVRADRGGHRLSLDHTTVLVGPEGGWSATERERTEAVDLGTTVLRSETAAIVAATLMVALRDRRLQ